MSESPAPEPNRFARRLEKLQAKQAQREPGRRPGRPRTEIPIGLTEEDLKKERRALRRFRGNPQAYRRFVLLTLQRATVRLERIMHKATDAKVFLDSLKEFQRLGQVLLIGTAPDDDEEGPRRKAAVIPIRGADEEE